jgi:hypothetical protein
MPLFTIVIFYLSAFTASSTVSKHTLQFRNWTRESQAEMNECCGREDHNSSSALLKITSGFKKKVAGPIPDVERYFLKEPTTL